MLDAFKSMTGGKSKLVQKQTDELELLISTAREERSAHQRHADRADHPQRQAGAAREDARAGLREGRPASPTRLDEIAKRLTALDDRTKELASSTSGSRRLKDSAKQAEQTTQKALGPDGELQKHREAVQHLSSQALGTQATLDTLKKERATLEELRGQLQKAEAEVKQSLGQSSTLKTELDQIRAVAATLTQDYAQDPRHVARSARGHDGGDDHGEGSREQARAAGAAPRIEPEHRGAADRAERARRARHAQGQGARHASSNRSNTPSCRPTASTKWSGRWTCRSAS